LFVYYYDVFVRRYSWRKCPRNFAQIILTCKATIHNIVTKLRATVSVLDKEQSRRSHVLSEEKLDDVSTRLEASLKKSSRLLQRGLARSTALLVENLKRYGLTKPHSYGAFCFQIASQEFDTLSGFRNRYSMDFLTQNSRFILAGHGSL
jgi:hypothetical protein